MIRHDLSQRNQSCQGCILEVTSYTLTFNDVQLEFQLSIEGEEGFLQVKAATLQR
jgi:hypothetical protein